MNRTMTRTSSMLVSSKLTNTSMRQPTHSFTKVSGPRDLLVLVPGHGLTCCPVSVQLMMH